MRRKMDRPSPRTSIRQERLPREQEVTQEQSSKRPPIVDRARGLRREQTPAEAKLWACLRNRQVGGFKFRRQHPIGPYVVDLYCAACRLVVEIDGESHAYTEAYDRRRTAWLTEQGYEVMRFTNREVLAHVEGVVEVILEVCDGCSVCPSPQPSPRRGEGAGSAEECISPEA